MASKTLMTIEQLEQLPEDGNKYELDEGELVAQRTPGRKHEVVKMNVAGSLFVYGRESAKGRAFCETGYVLGPATMRKPDVSFELAEHPENPDTQESPDLCVEIVSWETAKDLERKIRQYFASGARAVWVLYPDSEALHVFNSPNSVRILTVTDTLEMPDLLPGYSVPVKSLFAD